MLQLFIFKPLGSVGVGPEPSVTLFFIDLEVTFAPVHVAISLESQDVRGDPVEKPAVVADHRPHNRQS